MEKAAEFLKNLNNDKIKFATDAQFPNLGLHPGHLNIDLLRFTSTIRRKSRPVIRIKFQTQDNWVREAEFRLFITSQVREQLPSGYIYNSP